MFGYVTICEPELKVKDLNKYRAYYCGLCQALRKQHGVRGQMTLTYDMTFAVILLTSLYENPTDCCEFRCGYHPMRKQCALKNEISSYCADMNLLVSYYHLVDDWRDEKKLSGGIGEIALKGKAEKVADAYPRQAKAIERELEALSDCEKQNSQNIDEPAGCFGRLMEEIFVYQEDTWEETLRRLGFFLGKFIYVMDTYEDLEKDRKKGCYNPLNERYEQAKKAGNPQEFEDWCYQTLRMMIADASAAFEKLPCIQDEDILRNILYAGVWGRYQSIQDGKNQQKKGTDQP